MGDDWARTLFLVILGASPRSVLEEIGVDQSGEASTWRVEVRTRSVDLDAKGREALGNLRRSGFTHIRSVCARRLYLLHGTLDLDAVEHV
ncbi:MAG: hypothetical protein GY842_24635, partial [bacterium]|nr:hypothetical protein [bacterium]